MEDVNAEKDGGAGGGHVSHGGARACGTLHMEYPLTQHTVPPLNNAPLILPLNACWEI